MNKLLHVSQRQTLECIGIPIITRITSKCRIYCFLVHWGTGLNKTSSAWTGRCIVRRVIDWLSTHGWRIRGLASFQFYVRPESFCSSPELWAAASCSRTSFSVLRFPVLIWGGESLNLRRLPSHRCVFAAAFEAARLLEAFVRVAWSTTPMTELSDWASVCTESSLEVF